MRLFDDSGGDGDCEKENPRATSVSTIARSEAIPRRNGRDRQPQTQFDLAAVAHERPEPMYGKQPRSILPTLLDHRSEASESATIISTSAQNLARSRDAVRCRVKRRSRTDEPAGLMQRLDRNPVKVGNAQVAGLGGNCPGRDGVSAQHLRRYGLGSWGSGSYRGKLLESAASVSLLHVGGGYGFRLRR